MGHETEIRGEQAGGGLISARNSDNQTVFVGKKVLNKKRDNLTHSLEAAFAPERYEAARKGTKPSESIVAGMWHYRYGTSSPPSILETHWHEWMPARVATVWQVESGKWISQQKNVNHRITHNGDFSAWQIFNEQVHYADLGLWLERVLHTQNSTTGDSPKIAGMMDLLVTQGMWDASLRLAYQLEIAGSIEAAFGGQRPAKDAPNTAPSKQFLSYWAEICEEDWQKYGARLSTQNGFEDQISAISRSLALGPWCEQKRLAFVRTAVDAFLHNDLYRATQIFISRAKGSFGLVTASTLNEDLVLSAQGQPMTVGFNLPEAYMVYASEPAAVSTVLVGMPESYRLDLDQKAGEVAQVSPNRINVYSVTESRELLESEVENRWIPMQNNACIRRPEPESEDPVASDIYEIPQALIAIEASWQNPASLNRQSAKYLSELFLEKVKHFDEKREKMIKAGFTGDLGQSQTVDFLITGIENSLWLGERFAQDLKIVFPLLNIKTLSANQVLRQLKHAPQRLHLGKGSIVFAISQSGQTFPTLQATHAFNQLFEEGVIGGLFILTGELHSLMEVAIASPHLQGTTCRRIFTNGSGRRSAEPATLTVATTQETLTEILFYIARQTRQAFPDSSPFGMTLASEGLMALETIKRDFLSQTVVELIGATANGIIFKSKGSQKLIKSGRRWALHVTESSVIWGIHALYVFIVLGWAIPSGHIIPVSQIIFRGLLFPFSLSNNVFLLGLFNPLLILADVGIAIFGPWLWAVALRYCQGRQPFARTGKRTLVIGDLPWVHQLLKTYVSKLFSLSYGLTSLEVHGADPQDHMLHEFGHRIARGTLVFLGVPDGRHTQIQKNDEEAVIMTGKQFDGVRSIGVGPEIVALGHNPDICHKGFDDAVVLRSKINASRKGRLERISMDQQAMIEELRESRFSSFERLLAGYVFFWAMAKAVASFPLLRYPHWKSQSRTKIATTAAPVSGISLESHRVQAASYSHKAS